MSSKNMCYRPLFSHRNFMKTIVGYNISRFGDSIDAIVFSWLLYEVTGSAAMIALILAVNYLPTVLLQPFAAALSERMHKVRTIVACNAVRFLTVAVTAALYGMGMLNAAVLFGFVLVNSTVEAFESPASAALSPMLLPPELYTPGSAFKGAVGRVVELIGTACAGGIIGLFGSTTALLIDAFSFLICAGTIATIRIKEEPAAPGEVGASYLSDLKAGFFYVIKKPVVRTLLLLGAFLNFSSVPYSTFQTVFLADTLGMGPQMLSAAGLVLTAAMGAGSFLTPKLLARLKRRTLLALSCTATAAAYPVFAAAAFAPGAAARTAVLMAGLLLIGTAIGIINVLFNALFMEQVDQSYMARVSGLANAALTSMLPVGSLLCAAAAAFCPVWATFLIAGAFLLLAFLPISRTKGFQGM